MHINIHPLYVKYANYSKTANFGIFTQLNMFSLMSVMALLLTSNSSNVVLHNAQLSIELILFPANLSI